MKKNMNEIPAEIRRLYCKGNPQIQAWLYVVIVQNNKVPIEVLQECLEAYRLAKSTKENQWTKKFTLTMVSANFKDFLRFLNDKAGTKIEYKPNPKKRNQPSYNDYFNRRQMDGSFAYSGVTDDF